MNNQSNRQEIINRYEKIVQRWNDNQNLIRLFPDKYKNICKKLKGLKNGAKYNVIDVSEKVISDIGARFGEYQPMHDKDNRVLNECKKIKCKYKTDVPDFIFKCVQNLLKKEVII